jgi:Spy/CpxP family protein refolding chaperone
MKTAGLSLAALALVALVGPAGAQQGHAQKAGTPLVIRTTLSEKLQLTDDQKARIRELRFAAAHRRVELRAKLEDARLRLRELMTSEKFDEAAIKAQAAILGDLAGRTAQGRIEDRLALMSVLTPEQRKTARPMGGPEGMGQRRIVIRHRMMGQGGPGETGGPAGPGGRVGMLNLRGAGGGMQFFAPGAAGGPDGDDPMSWLDEELGGLGDEPIDVDVQVEAESE